MENTPIFHYDSDYIITTNCNSLLVVHNMLLYQLENELSYFYPYKSKPN